MKVFQYIHNSASLTQIFDKFSNAQHVVSNTEELQLNELVGTKELHWYEYL